MYNICEFEKNLGDKRVKKGGNGYNSKPISLRIKPKLFSGCMTSMGIARQMNRSASTVARYIRSGKDAPQALKHATRQTIG